MVWVFIGLLGGVAFVFLTRLYWGARGDDLTATGQRKPLVTVAIATLALALLMMIALGKLHWLSALVTGIIPFLRRATGLLRFAPLLQGLFGRAAQAGREGPNQSSTSATRSSLTITEARLMLEVPDNATAEQIISAHRRLIARNHPDKGGSTYIASQLNSARELLLEQLS